MTDHTDVVAHVKADLLAQNVSLVGPCGAFEITRRVAWLLRDEGAGLLMKNNGNNCAGYAVDIIAYTDGTIVDILVKGGGDEDAAGNPIPGTGNGPAWQVNPVKVDPTRWAPPVPWSVVVDVPPIGTDPPDPPTVPTDAAVMAVLGVLTQQVVNLGTEVSLLRDDLRTHADVKGLDVSVVVDALARLEAAQARGYGGSIFGVSFVLLPRPAPTRRAPR